MMKSAYIDTVRLLLDIAPEVFHRGVFALKGGTAINLFLHDMPRLSVDLDLVYVNHMSAREEALEQINATLYIVADQLESRGMKCRRGTSAEETKLFVEYKQVRIKIEANHVFRGSVLPVALRQLSQKVQDMFFTDIELPLLQPEEIYGSKLLAAMDRQHPRDLFDVLGMYEQGGITSGIVECFVSYLAGHNRPVHEVLFANQIDLTSAYINEFVGMTQETVSVEQLQQVRSKLFEELPSALTENHRDFLVGLLQCDPDWSLMSCPHLKEMPAIRWKLSNLQRLKEANLDKFSSQHEELRKQFDR